jgi:hypothetical protein
MIGTIGFLVQETSHRWRWLVATSLYTVACVCAGLLLGALLGALGGLAGHVVWPGPLPWAGAVLIGLLAIGYAASDLGGIALPRPTVMHAVPVTWWRRWRPYGAAAAYGAALGAGVTTRVAFGSLYVPWACCLLHGDVAYGAALMGTFGAARALVMFPASWGVWRHRTDAQAWFACSLFDLGRAQGIVAAVLLTFGAQALVTALTSALYPLL